MRTKDENGYLHVTESHLTKVGVFGYRGAQIPMTGLDLEKIYYGYRPADEIEKAAESFKGVPILLGHYVDSADSPQKEHRVGSVGTEVTFDGTYLDAELTITDAEAIKAIETEAAHEISAGYRYDVDMTAGEYEGTHYDFVQRNITGNHIALVPKGRAGRDVVVADEEDVLMDIMEFIKKIAETPEALEALRAALKPVEEKPAEDAEEVKEEAAGEEEKEPPVDREKLAQDAEDRAVAKVKGLMKAAQDVSAIYGRVDALAFDSADDIYGAALKANGINIDGVDKSAYAVMVGMLKKSAPAKRQGIAMDADGLEDVLAGLNSIVRG